ncbi:TetR/AcrR family transcriptional regulator [Pseudonocardia lacus]|uniref:TetR/AcrR family transcriptional regulator n=1 Tax=Pseudonocardia lacus TaxID=2835865 RepID=UPI001BDDC024|nr:TetR/AcrR family transcriptional regulator [Pseudonocardia lacus]
MVRKVRDLEVRLAEGNEKLTRLIDAAAHLFYTSGYDATSVRDIATAVGILKGSVYSHIDSKEDLLYSIVSEAHGRFVAALDEVRYTEGSPIARLRAHLTTYLRLIMTNLEKVRVYDRNWRSLSEPRRGNIAARQRAYQEGVADLIKQAQEAGEVRPDRNPAMLARLVLFSLNSLNSWFDPRLHDGEEVTREFVTTLIAGLQADAGPAAEKR